ncbi:MAG: methyltransferase domain-containing protein [Promethearchaeota archaeon]
MKIVLSKFRKNLKTFEKFFFVWFLPKGLRKKIRNTDFYGEIYRQPMNYFRIWEILLTFEFLDLKANLKILDISSPKILSLYLALNGYQNLIISDLEDYFINDFKIYNEVFKISTKLDIFDAIKIPYDDNSVDRVFSISVLEHIPESGDKKVLREVQRILKPGGIFVFTIPLYEDYLEEWVLPNENFSIYWKTKKQENRYFYQRRYNESSILTRFKLSGLTIEDIIYIAEVPIKEPEINNFGMVLFNYHYLNRFFLARLVKFIRKVPLLPYFYERFLSILHHYLTRNCNDKNIRHAVIKMIKRL